MLSRLLKARKSRRAGFTLIELLVVVLILGVLLAVAIPLYLSSVKTSSIKATQANMKTIAQAGQAYYVKSSPNAYPADITKIVGAGLDIENISGPQGVTYTAAPNGAGHFVVTATENGSDAFGTTATNESATYDLTTGTYALAGGGSM